MKQVWRRRPSPALVVAIIALVVAASGTAFAAGRLASGDNLIRKDSLSGDRLRRHTLTDSQINVNKLGTVPKAANAAHAGDADQLGGKPASAYLTVGGSSSGTATGTTTAPVFSPVGTQGVVKASGTVAGHTVPVLSSGPFTLTMTCTTNSDGGPSLTINAGSSENNSDLAGTFATANTPTDIGADVLDSTTPASYDGLNLTFEAPSGARLSLQGAVGVDSLGTDCWASLTGSA
jgi:hypothetical protein